MPNYPYTTVPGTLQALFDKMRDTGVPAKATIAWLESINFKSSNDRTMIRVVKFLGLATKDGTPTDTWNEYRAEDHQAVMRRAIQSAYTNLFDLYPQAQSCSSEDLRSFFKSGNAKGSKQVIDLTVNTFKALCSMADFSNADEGADVPIDTPTAQQPSPPANEIAATLGNAATALTVNINVQLTLPEAKDTATYDAIFKSMRKHLLQGE